MNWSTPEARMELSSVCIETGARIDTMVVRMPRIILAEFNTHRVISKTGDKVLNFSRNAASSRAIPVEKMIQQVLDDPFVPLVWTAKNPGMQGPVITDADQIRTLEIDWLAARDYAVKRARSMVDNGGVHKQVANRLLEPWMWVTDVVTACEWRGFFAQRVHEAAEPHMRILATFMKEVYDDATPQQLSVGQWHLPFTSDLKGEGETPNHVWYPSRALQISVARCASASYKTVDGFDMTFDRATELYRKLLDADPSHASPFEHQASADRRINDERWQFPELHGNLWGWRQFRRQLEMTGAINL